MILSKNDIVQLEQRYRTAFVNSLAGFRQAVLVGTQSVEGNSNLAIFNSLIHLGANPALFGLINRPESVQRDTLQNIKDTKVYTLNYVKAADYKKAHQTSARYDKGVSEFNKVGFTELYKSSCKAPYVAEAIVQISMQLEEIIPITINGTILIIGSIQTVELNDALVSNDGFVDLSAAEILISQGLDAYFTTSMIGRLDYAKP
ncbi:MAG: flavin reductase [Sphingobacteriia bacterium]|jgi:flavin reductase (DIM6/NTAB) family NADH-FMN oxidoreductase RutF